MTLDMILALPSADPERLYEEDPFLRGECRLAMAKEELGEEMTDEELQETLDTGEYDDCKGPSLPICPRAWASANTKEE